MLLLLNCLWMLLLLHDFDLVSLPSYEASVQKVELVWGPLGVLRSAKFLEDSMETDVRAYSCTPRVENRDRVSGPLVVCVRLDG